MEHLFLDSITVRFGHTSALDKVVMTCPERGVLALVGPNGAGKSTLLDVLSGFIVPSDGCIRFGQRSPQSPKVATADLRRRFVRLHQRLVVPPGLLVREYLCLAKHPDLATSMQGLMGNSWCKTDTVEDAVPNWLRDLLGGAGLSPSLDVEIGNLSYGQQRIVALGAVLLSPKWGILLDEPMAGLSGVAREAAKTIIVGLGQHRLLLIAEHDLDTVKAIADEIVVFVGGQAVARYLGADIARVDLLGHFLTGNAT